MGGTKYHRVDEVPEPKGCDNTVSGVFIVGIWGIVPPLIFFFLLKLIDLTIYT